ncbi:2Fe-2S iron-sulfur cluster-binding protein [Geothrix sp. PMB-07]|uniref:2Fe-2S iron-sulfur cluster-binding protein n=1 Tax=Geothrix sp. PMB-07 TaxID=3068640 RepID=UPI0027408736|nr:2Fe-2S iron-sulfur cluster-binding protein [Geothrix sp. PMB-07]WLT33331.1 2Fe-2S iron-sulfur cluster-binding protein [Geothrix sp. PMB-07]
MTVVARTRRRDHILSGRGTLMAQCLAVGLPVASACSGRGACGKCVLTILQGLERLPPPDSHELAVLERNGAEPAQRLGCQCVTGPATNELLVTTGYW